MDFVHHDKVSEFLQSTALSPPRRRGAGFDLLDVVVVDPNAKDPSMMLVPTKTNLTKHFTKQKLHKRDKMHESYSSKKPRRSEEAFELTDELQSTIGVDGVDTSAHGSHSSNAHVNIVISNEKTRSVSGVVMSQLEEMVHGNFASIVKNAARFHMNMNRSWYDYYTGHHQVYFLAVITKVSEGCLSIEESDSVASGLGVSAKVSGLWGALVDGNKSASNSLKASSEGVVGVQMLCFPFRKGEEKGVYSILESSSIRYMNKHERKWLQKASRRHSWSLVESQNEGQLYINRSRRWLADCKAAIGNAVSHVKEEAENVISHVKEEAKSHDYHQIKSGVKFVSIVLVALLLSISILSSIPTNAPIFHQSFAKLGPSQVLRIQQAFSQAFEEFIAHAMRVLLASH
jgi:hypothetical protein